MATYTHPSTTHPPTTSTPNPSTEIMGLKLTAYDRFEGVLISLLFHVLCPTIRITGVPGGTRCARLSKKVFIAIR